MTTLSHAHSNIAVMEKLTPEQRDEHYWSKVRKTRKCWWWMAAQDGHGYGVFWNGDRLVKAHHYLTGPPPPGMETDHVCRNRRCVNPDHLEFVTRKENLRRGTGAVRNISKNQCPHGHPYDAENTYFDSKGSRRCRTCYRRQASTWRKTVPK